MTNRWTDDKTAEAIATLLKESGEVLEAHKKPPQFPRRWWGWIVSVVVWFCIPALLLWAVGVPAPSAIRWSLLPAIVMPVVTGTCLACVWVFVVIANIAQEHLVGKNQELLLELQKWYGEQHAQPKVTRE